MSGSSDVTNSVLQSILDSREVETGKGERFPAYPVSIEKELGQFISNTVQERNATSTLEIGLAYGVSAMFVCEVHSKSGHGRHVAIDPWQGRWKNIGLENLERSGLNAYFEFRAGYTHDLLPEMVSEGLSFDFVFIDGQHLFDFVLDDFVFVDQLLAVGGCVAFDDVWLESVVQVIDFAKEQFGYNVLLWNEDLNACLLEKPGGSEE